MSAERSESWHTLSAQATLAALEATADGLDSAQVEARRAQYGPNRLPPPPRRGPLARLAAQFHNVLIYVLLVAGAVTLALGHWVDAGVILGVVVINALIGFIQEGKAEQALEAVRAMLSPQAQVLRDGRRVTVDADALVPGDVVFLQSGDRVPADLRLLRVKELRIDEALLTGESVPVGKTLEPVEAGAALGDRRCLAFSGTLVASGTGTGLVVATGVATEVGRISDMLAQVQVLTTPLMRQLAGFGRVLTGAILALAGAAFAFGILVRDYSAQDMFLAAVGLAVAAIPEGLPAIITITLAIGVQRMARRNAIIRRLPAVETLGSVTVICSDKTGTLTRNEMTVQSIVDATREVAVSGVGYAPVGGFLLDGRDLDVAGDPDLRALCQAGLLCNDATLAEVEGQWRVEGDPTEGALIVLARKAGLDPWRAAVDVPRTDVIPFESEHRFMATLHHDHAGHGFVYLKGAPEAVLPRCKAQREAGEDRPLDLAAWHTRSEAVAARGQRTLAVAMGPAAAEQRSLGFPDVAGGLTLLGIVGIIDPPREEAIAAVAESHEAGIGVKMITGDHARTAAAIADQMAIGSGTAALTGAQIADMDDGALRRAVGETDVFARASPADKLRLVEALQAQGEVVAMTGDGVNDSPALKRADVGVAMGIKGTEAAKEAAEMVLADDNFASIAHAVEEGRTVYDNIKKSIAFILPTNGGEALTLLAAIALGRLMPVTAAQILWVNMITAVTLALALAFEPAEADVMRRRPRDPRAPILSRFLLWRVAFVSLLMVAATFGLFLWEREHGASIELARTVAVNTLVMLEVAYLFNTRFLTAPAFGRHEAAGNRYIAIAVVAVVAFQLLFTYAPFMQFFFHSEAMDAASWARVLACAAALFVLVEVEKAVLRGARRG